MFLPGLSCPGFLAPCPVVMGPKPRPHFVIHVQNGSLPIPRALVDLLLGFSSCFLLTRGRNPPQTGLVGFDGPLLIIIDIFFFVLSFCSALLAWSVMLATGLPLVNPAASFFIRCGRTTTKPLRCNVSQKTKKPSTVTVVKTGTQALDGRYRMGFQD